LDAELIRMLDERFERIATKLDALSETVTQHTAGEAGCRQVVADLKRVVFGNGEPGLKIRVDRLEQARTHVLWLRGTLLTLLGGIITSIVAVACGWVPKWLKWW